MTKNLTEGNPAKVLFFFTLPLIAGNMFQQLYSLVDTFIVGRFLGVEALAAVGCTGSLMFLMMGFIMGLTSGFTIRTGQKFGAGDMAGVRRSTAACVLLSVVSSVVLTALGIAFSRDILVWMQTPPEILEGAVSFISIIYGGMSMWVFFMLETNIIRALGDSKTSTYMLGFGLLLNILLEPVFIVVLDWGIPGAAWATIVSQIIGNTLCLFYMLRRFPVLRVQRQDWHLSLQELWKHARLGLPMAFQTSIIALGTIIMQVAVNHLGALAVAAYAVAQKVDSIATMPAMSFGLAIAAYAAQNYGARQYQRIDEGIKKCLWMSISFSLAAAVFNILAGPWIMGIFVGSGEAEVIEYGRLYLVVNGIFYAVMAAMFVYRNALQGLGQAMIPTIAGVLELLMRAVGAILLVEWWGYLGICFANPLAWIVSTIPMAYTFYSMQRGFHQRLRAGREL